MRKLVFLSVLWLAAHPTAWSAPREIKPPPVGDTIRVRVMRGLSVPITLEAFERRGNPLAYEIAREPRHGNLESFRQADANNQGSASVVYRHGDDDDSKTDEFTFRARGLLGGGVSSPIKVQVEILDAAPVFQITPGVDFTAIAGETDRQQIILANEGGGTIEGRIAPEEPFEVEGDGFFRLGRKQITNTVIRFSPRHTGPVAVQRIFPAPAHPGGKIELRGQVNPPFMATAEPIMLQPDGSRTGGIAITNLSASDISVRLAGQPAGMLAIPSRTSSIRANETVTIPLRMSAEKAGDSFKLTVSVSNERHEQELSLVFPAVPAKLTLLTPELDFREQNETTLVVTNKGGLEERFTLDLPSDVKALSKSGDFVVPAGKKTSVDFRWERRADQEPGNALFAVRDEPTAIPVLRPAALRVVTEALDFRNSSTAELVVQNRGDNGGEFRLQVPQGFRTDGKEERWEVPRRGQTIVTVRRVSPDAAIRGQHVVVDGGNSGKTTVPIVTTNEPTSEPPAVAYPWQLNTHVRAVSSPERILIEWLADKEGWSAAVLEKADGADWQIYEPEPEKKSWWEGITDLFTGPKKGVSDAVEKAKGFFEDRVNVSPEPTEEPVQSETSHADWQKARISAADLEDPTATWRITAQPAGSAERRQASAPFHLDKLQKTLNVAGQAKEPPEPDGPRPSAKQPLVMRKLYDGRTLDLTIGLVGEKEATDFIVERVIGFGVPNGGPPTPDGNPLERLVCRELPESAASIASVGTARSGETEIRTVRLLLKDLPRGQTFLCRLVPMQNGQKAAPTAPFEVAGPPAIAVPWRLLLFTAMLFVVLWLVRERMKSRRY